MCIFFYVKQKFKMATQKWLENNFWEKMPVHSTDTLGVKNFVKITLSHTVSETLKIFHFQCLEKLWPLINCY